MIRVRFMFVALFAVISVITVASGCGDLTVEEYRSELYADAIDSGLAKDESGILLSVSCYGLEGYIDSFGNMVISPRYTSSEVFFVGPLAIARTKKQFGWIDRSGEFVVNVAGRFDTLGRLSNGLAFVRKGGKYGYIDASGRIVLELERLTKLFL